jgi:cation transport ATPase
MHREYQPAQMAFGHARNADHDHRHDHEHEHDHEAELRWLVATTALVGLLLGADLILVASGSEYRRPLGIPLSLAAALIGGGRVVYLALAALFEGRIGADLALAVACVAAGVLGEYFVAAEVVFIALVGECLEAFTFDRAQRAIQKLLEYRPTTARVVRDGQEVDVSADALKVGDVLAIRPGERIAADGTVVTGRSAATRRCSPASPCPSTKVRATRSTPAPSTSSGGSRSALSGSAPRRRSAR